jgi:hypothetical protein
MDRWDQQKIGDRIAEWTAALSLGLASGFAGFALAPANVYPLAPAASGIAAALAMTLIGLGVMRQVKGDPVVGSSFELVEFPDDILLLDVVATAEDDALLLDDPIAPIADDSRVVRLFAPETIAAPGELAERIDHWLEGARGRVRVEQPQVASGHGPRSSSASAALHAALDDIRRSLR